MQKDPHGGEKVTDNPFGSRWMGLEVPGHEDGLEYGIHGTDTPETIGEYETDGCIRMDNNDAKELYSLVKIETPVIIISDKIFIDINRALIFLRNIILWSILEKIQKVG